MYCVFQGGAVVTQLPPTSEVGCSNQGPYVEKLVVAHQCLLPTKLPVVI